MVSKIIRNFRVQFSDWDAVVRNEIVQEFIQMRKFCGLTQGELAEATGRAERSIQYIEAGTTALKEAEFFAYTKSAINYAISIDRLDEDPNVFNLESFLKFRMRLKGTS